MPRNTSVTLGEHFSSFISVKIAAGRLESASEAVRAGLRLLEAEEAKFEVLRTAIQEGVDSGISERTPEEIRTGVKKRLKASARLSSE